MVAISDALALEGADIVAIVGAGGKTTTLRWLADERAAAGEHVLVLTTTKIEPQAGLRTVFVAAAGDLAVLGPPWPVLAVTEDLGARLRGVPPEWIDGLAGRGWRLLAQCDGSARRPFKAPGEGEPVVPACATVVVSVVGLDVLGAPLDATRVHRPERVTALTGLQPGESVTPDTIIDVLLHPDGGGRNVPAAARRVVFLNKCEWEGAWKVAREIGAALGASGIPTFAGSLRDRKLEVVG